MSIEYKHTHLIFFQLEYTYVHCIIKVSNVCPPIFSSFFFFFLTKQDGYGTKVAFVSSQLEKPPMLNMYFSMVFNSKRTTCCLNVSYKCALHVCLWVTKKKNFFFSYKLKCWASWMSWLRIFRFLIIFRGPQPYKA